MITPEEILRDQAEDRFGGPIEQQFRRQAASQVLDELTRLRDLLAARTADHDAVVAERDAALEQVAELEAELAELSERCYRKDLELDELRHP